MKAILVGYGEIGRGVKEVFGEHHHVDVYDPITQPDKPSGQYDILLVALPFMPTFAEVVGSYQKEYGVKSTIIFSTVAVGTCRQLGAAHCPVEGKHPNLAESIQVSDKWLGGKSVVAEHFLESAGFKVNVLDKPEYTEFMKLRSTTVYGLNIEFARYTKEICDQLGLDYENIKAWDKWVNGIYKHFGMDWATRYILDAPTGPKGGHCVTPNATILQGQFPHPLVNIVASDGRAT